MISNKLDRASLFFLKMKKVAEAFNNNFEDYKWQSPKTVTETFNDFFKYKGYEKEFQKQYLQSKWQDIIGKYIAENTYIYQKENTLYIKTNSAKWFVVLKGMEMAILNKINKEVPKANITNIKFLSPEINNNNQKWFKINRNIL